MTCTCPDKDAAACGRKRNYASACRCPCHDAPAAKPPQTDQGEKREALPCCGSTNPHQHMSWCEKTIQRGYRSQHE